MAVSGPAARTEGIVAPADLPEPGTNDTEGQDFYRHDTMETALSDNGRLDGSLPEQPSHSVIRNRQTLATYNDSSFGHDDVDLEASRPVKYSDHYSSRKPLSFAQRSLRVTWAWFPVNMSTGAMASLLSQQPFTFAGLDEIGIVFYIVNLVLFCTFSALLAARFARKPRAFTTSLHHPSESFFFGSFWVAIALLIYGMQVYGVPACGPWLVSALRVIFWMYFACAILVAVLQYHVIFQVEKLSPSDAMPAWILPAYPFLVTGSVAAAIAKTQPPQSAINIIIAGLAGQGLGWILALLIYTVYLSRLIHSNMPEPSVRPGMYVSVGPTGYTCAGLITLGKQAKQQIPPDFLGTLQTPVGDIWYAISVPAALFLWLTAIWFSALSTVSVLRGSRQMSFSLQWWAFVFPNVGLAIATIQIGEALSSNPIKIAGTVITIILVPLWFFCAVMHIRAVWLRQILAPGKDIGVDDVNYRHDEKAAKARGKKAQKRADKERRRATFNEK
jgi:C4-dicarboxylate transporter/malic acid transport protein